MASAALSLVDRLIQLATVRAKNREKYFNNFIEPLYSDGEQIAKDYMALLTELIHRIAQARDSREIAVWLEEKRSAFQPLRIKVRALIEGEFMRRESPDEKDSITLFKTGLWGLMKGGASWEDEGHALTWEHGFGDHTVLDLLRHARMQSLSTEWRELLTRHASRQRKAIEMAWQDVAKAYAHLRHEYLT